MRDSRGAVGPPSRREQTKRVLLQPPGPARTQQLRDLGFIPKGKSPGRTKVRSTGGPGAGIANALFGAGVDLVSGPAYGLAHAPELRHPRAHPLAPLQVASSVLPVDELPFALARALKIGGGASRLGHIASGPDYTKDWKMGKHGQLETPEGKVVTSRYPRSPSHIEYRVPIEGGSGYRARTSRPNDYFMKVLGAFGELKAGGSYPWEMPGMNIAGGSRGKITGHRQDPSGMHHFRVTLPNGIEAHYSTTRFDERTMNDIEYGYVMPEVVYDAKGNRIPLPDTGMQRPVLGQPPHYGAKNKPTFGGS